jgi:hypothetical protein
MLGATTAAYVWVYTEEGVRVYPAMTVAGANERVARPHRDAQRRSQFAFRILLIELESQVLFEGLVFPYSRGQGIHRPA